MRLSVRLSEERVHRKNLMLVCKENPNVLESFQVQADSKPGGGPFQTMG
jgi:hypothetical protein